MDQKFDVVEESWLETIVCSRDTLIVARNAIRLFRDFVSALFEPEVTAAIRTLMMPQPGYGHPIPPAVREAIIAAGRRRQLIQMTHGGIDRTVEPHSFRFRVTRKDGMGREYFYGYDRTRGPTIKSFLLHRVEAVSILPDIYQPRWVVEF